MDRLLPLTTFALENPDFNTIDEQAELERYIERQRAIARCLDGQEYPDVVLDMLEAHAIDPVAYVDEVEASIDLIICQCLPVSLV